MSTLPRLFIDSDLSADATVEIQGNPAHYLSRVMRLGPGDKFRSFNGRDGEWLLEIQGGNQKRLQCKSLEQLREQPAPVATAPDLMFAPLKKIRTDFVAEKAAEMGVGRILPVITARTQTKTVRADRLESLVIEASEQTERMDVPEVLDAQSLKSAVNNYPGRIFFCDEAGDSAHEVWGGLKGRAEGFATQNLDSSENSSIALLVGPEGGFSPDERAWLRSLDFVTPVTLGPRILRAETAVVAALTIWQALAGDWLQSPREL